MKLSFLAQNYKFTLFWSIIQYTRHFSKITNLHKLRFFIVHFSQFWENPKSPKFLKLHFDVFDDFFHRNSIEKKNKFIWGDICFFFVINVFFSFLGDNNGEKKTFITKKNIYHNILPKFGSILANFGPKNGISRINTFS